MFPRCNTYRLYERGEAGICCDVDGVSLGPVKLVERADKAYFVRPAEDITLALEAAYGPLPEADADILVLKIVGIARSLNRGEMFQAQLKTLYLRRPEIPAENFAKMGRVVVAKVDSREVEMTVAEKATAEVAANDLEMALTKALEMSQKAVAKVNNNTATECRDEKGRWCIDPAAVSVYHGKKYSVSARQVGNIIYNETRSFSGPQRDDAMAHIAHVILNRADAGKGIGGGLTSSPNVDAAKVPKVEQTTYDAAQAAATKVINDRNENKTDPTGGAIYYNFRGSDSKKPWIGYEHSTQSGPFDNSYPTDGINGHINGRDKLPASGVYVNTYYNRQVVKPRK